MSLRMHLLPVLLLTGALVAGEAVPAPDRFELEDAFLRWRAHDLARTRERLREGPYARFAGTVVGQMLLGQLDLALQEDGRFDRPALEELVGGLHRHLGAFRMVDGFNEDPMSQLALAVDDGAAAIAALDLLSVIEGEGGGDPPTWYLFGEDELRLERRADLLLLQFREPEAIAIQTRKAEPLPDLDPNCDVEAVLDLVPFATAIRQEQRQRNYHDEEAEFACKLIEELQLAYRLTFTGQGMREHATATPRGMAAQILRWNDSAQVEKSVFADLPPDTVWAVAWSEGLKSVAALPRELLLADIIRDEEAVFLVAVLECLDGPSLLYAQEVDDRLAITLRLGITENLGRIAAAHVDELVRDLWRDLARELRYMLPRAMRARLEASKPPAIEAAYIDGALVISNHPNWESVASPPVQVGDGFVGRPAVAAALRELPDQA